RRKEGSGKDVQGIVAGENRDRDRTIAAGAEGRVKACDVGPQRVEAGTGRQRQVQRQSAGVQPAAEVDRPERRRVVAQRDRALGGCASTAATLLLLVVEVTFVPRAGRDRPATWE